MSQAQTLVARAFGCKYEILRVSSRVKVVTTLRDGPGFSLRHNSLCNRAFHLLPSTCPVLPLEDQTAGSVTCLARH